MPWTPRATRFLLSKGSPLTPEQRQKMLGELHRDPSLAHAKKGASLKTMMGAKRKAT